MKHKMYLALITFVLIITSVYSTFAQELDMYINGQFIKRDVQSIAGFDMLPVLDIAGELGFQVSFNGTNVVMSNQKTTYIFQLDNAVVLDNYNHVYSLDVAPQFINGKFMVPAMFFQKALDKSYIWDSVTNTIFLGSEDIYYWLINTEEYKNPTTPKYPFTDELKEIQTIDGYTWHTESYDLDSDGKTDNVTLNHYGAYDVKTVLTINNQSVDVQNAYKTFCRSIYVCDIDQKDKYLDIIVFMQSGDVWAYVYRYKNGFIEEATCINNGEIFPRMFLFEGVDMDDAWLTKVKSSSLSVNDTSWQPAGFTLTANGVDSYYEKTGDFSFKKVY